MDNFLGVIVGDKDMNKKTAAEVWFEETYGGMKNKPFNLSDLFVHEDENFVDCTTKVYSY